MSGEFTEEERKILSQFTTNTDKQVFALINLPEVVKGALFSRYSRSAKSLRRVLLDEFILKPETGFREIVNYQVSDSASQSVAIKKAEEFYDRVLVGYGDDSVAELAGAHVAIEDISNIATKAIEDSRIGLSPLEKSTRYVYFDQKRNGRWLYCEEPDIMQSEFADTYRRTCNHLFETYTKLIPKISRYVSEKYPKEEAVSERAYAASVRAKTCDLLRGLLPASTMTNMGIFGNGRAFEYLLTKMYASSMQEIRGLASSLQQELQAVIPSFVKRADSVHGKEMQQYVRDTDMAAAKLAEAKLQDFKFEKEEREAVLVDYDADGDEKAVAAMLYQYSGIPLSQAYIISRNMGEEEKEQLISAYVGKRGNRRHKPYRAFEQVHYTFDILANFGAYRDLHRHRILTQQRQLLTCNNGYTLPKELSDSGHDGEFRDAMENAKNAFDAIAGKMPEKAQYVVPFAYKLRWLIKMNLREAYHFCELRSMQQGHPDYRHIAQQMYSEILRVHPLLGRHMTFVDMKEYAFERLEAEKKLDMKLEEVRKKYGQYS